MASWPRAVPLATAAIVMTCLPASAEQEQAKCHVVCELEWKVEPTFTVETSLDYVATGLPKRGDVFADGTRYADDASPWSLSFVFVIPAAPF